jgi:hypothetical protein
MFQLERKLSSGWRAEIRIEGCEIGLPSPQFYCVYMVGILGGV